MRRRRPPSEWGDAHAGIPLALWADTDELNVAEWIFSHYTSQSRILDCGVGTGRVAAPLVAAGATVLGLDASPKMIALAEARGIPCKLADLGERWPRPLGRFDAILMCSNFLGQLESATRQRRALAEARKRARVAWTMLAVQTHYATPEALERWRAGGGEIDEAAQLVRSRATWPDGEHVQQWRYLTPEQLIEIAESVGWRFRSLAGDFAGGPLHTGSPQYVAIFDAA